MRRRNGLSTVVRKELRRFFTDRRMVFTTVFLPAVMIFVIYSLIGSVMANINSVSPDYQAKAYVVGLPAELAPLAQAAGLRLQPVDAGQIDAIKAQIADKTSDLLVVFPDGFSAEVAAGLAAAGQPAAGQAADGLGTPQVEVYFNSTRTESTQQYGLMTGLLDSYKNSLAPLFTVNSAAGGGYDLASQEDTSGMVLSALVPLLVLIFLFTGTIGVTPESIAGEKERGTIATILVTPLARWQLALGKVVSLSCITLLSGLSSFVGVMLSLPRILGSASGSLNVAAYSLGDFALLLGVILSTVLVLVGLVALLSALARTVREASTYATPLMLVIMLIGVLGMFSQGASGSPAVYLIPVFNSIQSMIGIFSFTVSPLLVIQTIGVNIVVAGLCVLALTRMFGSERIIFSH
ncbi:MAG: ABC transporter permease [Coriobacteriia bacterium]|nr:ABC transporter permease [Coriobacteriia bacterium]